MVVVSGWTGWHGIKGILRAFKEHKQLRADLQKSEQQFKGLADAQEKLGERLHKVEQERERLEKELEEAQEREPPEADSKLEERERENRRLARQLARQSSGGVGGVTVTTPIPPEMVSARHVVQRSFLLAELLELAGEGPRLVGWTFEGCWLIGPAVVTFTGLTTIEQVEIKGSPDTVLYEVGSYGDEASGSIQLDSCTFRECTFGRMGLAAASSDQQWLRDKFTFSLP
jgi:hypothetical protein